MWKDLENLKKISLMENLEKLEKIIFAIFFTKKVPTYNGQDM